MIVIADVAGLTNARNGRTHQTVSQPGAALMIPGITFLEPWDALDTFNCLNWAIGESRGVVYLRIHSSTVVSQGFVPHKRNINYYELTPYEEKPDAVIVASGLTVGLALNAVQLLAAEGICIRVINVVNPKALDRSFAGLVPTDRPLLTVYNGAPEVLSYSVSRALHGARAGYKGEMRSIGFHSGTTGTLEEPPRTFPS